MRRYINGTEVRPGAVITSLVSTEAVLGRRLKAGAVCESFQPEAWRAIIEAEDTRLWESGSTVTSYEEADRFARERARSSLDRALRDLFA